MKAWQYFNCDLHNSSSSMNPLINYVVFLDNKIGRKKLYELIENEYFTNSIELFGSEYDLEIIKKDIIEGNPLNANDYIQYGCILQVEIKG